MSRDATPSARQGQQTFSAATFSLLVEWDASQSPRSARVATTLTPLQAGVARHIVTLTIPPASDATRTTFELQGVAITLALRLASPVDAPALVELRLEYPIDPSRFFNNTIASWPDLRPSPAPGPRPEPHPISSNAAGDELLFPFVSSQASDPLRAIERALLFIEIEAPSALPLYNELAASRDAAAPQQAMRQDAADYIATSAFISAPDALPAPLNALPPMLDPLRALDRDMEPAALTLAIDALLAPAGYADLNAFFTAPTFQASRDDLWQSLIALSIVASAQQAALADTLVTTLRVLALLTATHSWSAGQPWLLRTPLERRELLDALPALPLGVSLPTPALTDDGWVVPLGVGALQHVRQRLLGYEPGDIAYITNLMPGERSEVVQRTLERELQIESARGDQEQLDTQAAEIAAHDSLEEELRGVIHAECMLRDLSNVTPSYGNLNMLLSGTGKDDGCERTRDDGRAARYARDVTERATSRVARRVRTLRTLRALREQERRATTTLDNAASNAPRAGVYRWLRKLISVSLVEAGRRVFIEVMVPDPASSYRDTLPLVEGVPLVKPPEIEPLAKADPVLITPENYRTFAATYALHDLPEPPPASLRSHAQLGPGLPLSATLRAPAGYTPSALTLAAVMSDATLPIVGVAAGQPFSLAAATSTAAVAAPTPCAGCDEPIPTPTPPTPGAKTLSVAAPTSGEAIITAISQAPSWHLSAELVSDRDTTSDALTAWQQTVYQRLLERYQALLRAWNGALEAHIKRDAPRARTIEREALRAKAQLALWTHTSPPAGASPSPAFLRLLQETLEWPEQTYGFAPWDTGDPEPAPLPSQWHGEQAPGLPAPDATFRAFITAGSARVIIPVTPGAAAALLHLLSFGAAWPGTRESAPICAANITTILDLRPLEPPVAPLQEPWIVALPTDLLLIDGCSLDAAE